MYLVYSNDRDADLVAVACTDLRRIELERWICNSIFAIYAS